jgi:lipopolysaccharide export LptBFGC system permease protein LptF
MMSLYVVFDLFFNMDEFTEGGRSLAAVLAGIGVFYGANLFSYFSQLSGVITVVAGMLTLGRLRRLNELTALLASGVSLYRVAVPIIAFGVATNVLWFVNAEWIVPSVAHILARPHEDPLGDRTYEVNLLKDRDNALLAAQQFLPATGNMERLVVMMRDERGSLQELIEAEQAHWEPLEGHPAGGRWKLDRGIRRWRELRGAAAFGPQERLHEEYLRYYDSDLTPRDIQMRQSARWMRFLSTGQLADIAAADPAQSREAARIKHERIATPVVNLVLLLLGMPFLLRREGANLLGDAAKCMIACGLCFVLFVAGQNMNLAGMVALPSWVPILVFAPLAVVLLDRVKT